MNELLIARLAAWLKIPEGEARRRFEATQVARTLAAGQSNLCYQTVDYVFACLREELEADDAVTDDFERPEEMAEGLFVRSH